MTPTQAQRILSICKKRGWSLHWTHRGAYLHLEASELIEAIRGKRGDPILEAADVLIRTDVNHRGQWHSVATRGASVKREVRLAGIFSPL